MNLKRDLSNKFNPVVSHVKQTYESVKGSGSAVIVIHNDSIVTEKYLGTHSKKINAKPIQEDTQFHVASVRKSYIGFAVAYAIYYGYIESIDYPVTKYLPWLNLELLNGTTIRHLLTHTHGLNDKEDLIYREFAPGESWAYRQTGINMLTRIVKETTRKTIANINFDQVFKPLEFKESGWYSKRNENLVDVILRYPNDTDWKTSESTEGDKMNMYVSARELAFWGYLHLKEGNVNGKQIVPKEIIQMATSMQSPTNIANDLPQNGFLWFVKNYPTEKTEIGEEVPKGSFQILGYTGVTLLVVPQKNLVAVRMFNSFGSPEGYDYLSDVRSFGDTVMSCL